MVVMVQNGEHALLHSNIHLSSMPNSYYIQKTGVVESLLAYVSKTDKVIDLQKNSPGIAAHDMVHSICIHILEERKMAKRLARNLI